MALLPLWVKLTASASVLVLVAVTAAGWWVSRQVTGNLTVVDLDGARLPIPVDTSDATVPGLVDIPPISAPAPSAPQVSTFLLLGVDTRAGANAEYAGGTGGNLSDVMMLVGFADDGSSAYAVSLPRDLVVAIPSSQACESGAGRVSRINAAWAIGGAPCAVSTVEALTGVQVDHVAAIDFAGFVGVVDTLGGVEVCVTRDIDDDATKLQLAAGTHVLDGVQALAFARTRKSLTGGGDLPRVDRQQYLARQLFEQVSSSELLRDPVQAVSVLSQLASTMTVDSGLASAGRLFDLVNQLRALDPKQVVTVTYPTRPNSAQSYTVVPDSVAAAKVLAPFSSGVFPDRPPSGAKRSTGLSVVCP